MATPDAGGDLLPAVDKDEGLKPSAMRGNELMYGFLVAAELLAVSVANLTITHGKGAPAHPPTTNALIGLGGSILLAVVLYISRNRMIAGFACIIAAFFATDMRVPNSLVLTHLLALVIPVVYAILLTQRQRKATLAITRNRRQTSSVDRRERADSRRQDRRARRSGAAVATGPQASKRYTPPKPKRARRR